VTTITRDELRGISVGGLICLHVNRKNDLNIKPSQIKPIQSTLTPEGNVRVKLEPTPETGWQNGPIEVLIPPVKVDEIYEETELVFQDIGSMTREEVFVHLSLPPPPPELVEVEEYLMLDPGPELKIKYRLHYKNVFFKGSVVVRVTGAPNNLDSLQTLNNLLIGE
jgi:hypothetical protein